MYSVKIKPQEYKELITNKTSNRYFVEVISIKKNDLAKNIFLEYRQETKIIKSGIHFHLARYNTELFGIKTDYPDIGMLCIDIELECLDK